MDESINELGVLKNSAIDIDIKLLLEYMVEKRIDPNSFFVAMVLLNYKNDSDIVAILTREIRFNNVDTLEEHFDLIRKSLKHLSNVGIIKDTNNVINRVKTYDMQYLNVDKSKFLISKVLNTEEVELLDKKKAADELFSAYPKIIKVQNKVYPARNIPPTILEDVYYNAIDGDAEVHKRIINILNLIRTKNKGLSIGLRAFVEKRYWEVIEEAPESVGLKGLFLNTSDNDNYYDSDDLVRNV